MAPSFSGAPGKNPKHQEAAPIQKQYKCKQERYIKTGLETLLDK